MILVSTEAAMTAAGRLREGGHSTRIATTIRKGDPARQVAVEANEPRYSSSIPCKHCGKIGERYTKSRYCVACHRERVKLSYRKQHGFKRKVV